MVGDPTTTGGEVKAVVVLRQGAQASEQELIERFRERIGRFQAPALTVDFRPSCPRTANGSQSRGRRGKEPHWQGRDRKVN